MFKLSLDPGFKFTVPLSLVTPMSFAVLVEGSKVRHNKEVKRSIRLWYDYVWNLTQYGWDRQGVLFNVVCLIGVHSIYGVFPNWDKGLLFVLSVVALESISLRINPSTLSTSEHQRFNDNTQTVCASILQISISIERQKGKQSGT